MQKGGDNEDNYEEDDYEDDDRELVYHDAPAQKQPEPSPTTQARPL